MLRRLKDWWNFKFLDLDAKRNYKSLQGSMSKTMGGMGAIGTLKPKSRKARLLAFCKRFL